MSSTSQLTTLGQLKDSTDLLLKAVDYLEGFK